MYKKVIVLELKQEYALAMEEGGAVLRIRRKDAMQVGDRLYVLPEDLYAAEGSGKVFPFMTRQKGNPGLGWPRRLAAIAAMLALIITVMLPKLTTPARAAVVSFDARGEVQVELDENHLVLRADSMDGSVRREALNQMRGKNLADLGEDLQELLGNGPVVMAYASVTDGAADDLERMLRQLFADQGAICLSGSANDVSDADEQSVSLGRYLLGLRMTEEQLDQMEDLLETWEEQELPEDQDDMEDVLEEMDLTELLALAEQEPSWVAHPDFLEALCEKLENAWEDAEEPLDTDDSDSEHDRDDEPDDDHEEDEDQEDELDEDDQD